MKCAFIPLLRQDKRNTLILKDPEQYNERYGNYFPFLSVSSRKSKYASNPFPKIKTDKTLK